MIREHLVSLAYAYFFIVKFAGYTIVATYLNRGFPEKQRNIFLVGITRTAIGALFGLLAMQLLHVTLPVHGGFGLFEYIAGFVVVRSIEWFILIRAFYWLPYTKSELPTTIPFLIIWSFMLDIPAGLGLLGAAVAAIC